MKLDKERLIARDPEALKTFERVVRECVRIGASQVGAMDFVDDIAQELMLLILFRTIHVYDPDREIEPFLIKSAKFAGMSLRRKHGREVLMGDGEDDLGGNWIDSVADADAEDLGDRMDRETAEAQAEAETFLAAVASDIAAYHAEDSASTFGSIDEQPSIDPTSPPVAKGVKRSVTPKSRRKPKVRRATNAWDALMQAEQEGLVGSRRSLSPEASCIREVRRRIKYTHKWMADALGITVSQLHAVEYGVTEPSKQLADRAEALLAEARAKAPMLLDVSTPDIVTSWFRRLGLAEDNYSGFAQEIGVNRSTAFRWLRRTYKPTPDRLWLIEALVQEAERRRNDLSRHVPRAV